jgi:anti-sigma regulatory factor (Ser/Thr protein kinase)
MHAYLGRAPGTVYVMAWCEANYLVVQIWDEGHGLIQRADSPGLGVGIPIMARMADDFRIGRRDGAPGTVVSLRFSLAHRGSGWTCA